jgi:hypothetical protein
MADGRMFDEFQSSTPGYWRPGEEERFPWASTGSVWYGLVVLENGKLERYGWTSAKSQMTDLLAVLQRVQKLNVPALLIGSWSGEFKTHFFVLDPAASIPHLHKVLEA